jgi:outer membrane PBP1 activator LpoA protein
MALGLAACDTVGGPGGGPTVDPSGSVQVALLVPGGSGQASDELLATSLQNAARLAIADLAGVSIDLRVYNTAGQAAQAQAMAVQAMDEGAQIILGPVYAQEANAVGSAAAGRGINVLTFSNNIDVAGGNVFVLGNTFDNSARRLARYAVGNGAGRIMAVHERNPAGEAGRAAIARGVAAAGGTLVANASYEFSQNGIVQAVPGIASSARSSGANALFLTAETAGALPILTQLLRENGLDAASTRFIGLTRWDIPAEALALPGLQGGLFALPDPGLYGLFQNRYQAAYAQPPHPIASLGYDGIAAVGALVKSGNRSALSASALTQGSGFAGVTGVFRFLPDGTNERQLAVAQIRAGQAVVVDPAPRSFGGFGF